MRLKVDIDEADVGRVREGNAATFTVDAYPDRTFSSQVSSLRNDPKRVQNVVTYEAILTVDNHERLLKPGMTATAAIVTDVRHDVLLVPNAALRFIPPGATPGPAKPGWKSVWTPAPREVTVRVGATDGSSTELVEGSLAAGDTVAVDLEDAQ